LGIEKLGLHNPAQGGLCKGGGSDFKKVWFRVGGLITSSQKHMFYYVNPNESCVGIVETIAKTTLLLIFVVRNMISGSLRTPFLPANSL